MFDGNLGGVYLQVAPPGQGVLGARGVGLVPALEHDQTASRNLRLHLTSIQQSRICDGTYQSGSPGRVFLDERCDGARSNYLGPHDRAQGHWRDWYYLAAAIIGVHRPRRLRRTPINAALSASPVPGSHSRCLILAPPRAKTRLHVELSFFLVSAEVGRGARAC